MRWPPRVNPNAGPYHCDKQSEPALAKAGEAISTSRIGFVFRDTQSALFLLTYFQKSN
jgi:hypothetical protein